MNSRVLDYRATRLTQYATVEVGGLARCNIERLHHKHRRILHNRHDQYVRPIESAAAWLWERESSNSRHV